MISYGYIYDVHMVNFCIQAGLKVANLPWMNEYLPHNHSPRNWNTPRENKLEGEGCQVFIHIDKVAVRK